MKNMNLYDIDRELESLLDADTGEITDFERFTQLHMARDAKIENTALYIKNLRAFARDARAEEQALADRRRTAEKKADRLESYLDSVLGGEKYASARVEIKYRKSKSVEIDADFIAWAERYMPSLLRQKVPEADKAAIKNWLESYGNLEHARLIERQSMIIK